MHEAHLKVWNVFMCYCEMCINSKQNLETSFIHILSSSCEIALRWVPQSNIDDESTLVQVKLSGNNPLHELMLAQIRVGICGQ